MHAEIFRFLLAKGLKIMSNFFSHILFTTHCTTMVYCRYKTNKIPYIFLVVQNVKQLSKATDYVEITFCCTWNLFEFSFAHLQATKCKYLQPSSSDRFKPPSFFFQ